MTATATPDRKAVRLSEAIRVTFAVEGPAPLRVEVPKQLLVPESDRDWKVQPVGKPTVARLGERERWVQVYRLDPYVAGDAMHVEFAPLKVNGQDTRAERFNVKVISTNPAAKDEAARPVTGIEDLPAPPIEPQSPPVGLWAGAALVVLVVGVMAWRARRRPKPVPPGAWAAAAFDRLEKSGATGTALADGVATVVRGFIDRRFGIPAPRLTTQELLVATEQAGWPVEQTDPLRLLLDDCDRAKFAGDVPDDDGCRSLLVRGREWVNGVGPDAGPG